MEWNGSWFLVVVCYIQSTAWIRYKQWSAQNLDWRYDLQEPNENISHNIHIKTWPWWRFRQQQPVFAGWRSWIPLLPARGMDDLIGLCAQLQDATKRLQEERKLLEKRSSGYWRDTQVYSFADPIKYKAHCWGLLEVPRRQEACCELGRRSDWREEGEI